MITVKNGTRVPVEFVRAGKGYSGLAALDGDRVLFPAPANALRGINAGTVDGEPVRVVSVAPSETVPSVLVVTFAQ